MPCQPAIASMSLGGSDVHLLDQKIRFAAEAGFKGIEIFYDCLKKIADNFCYSGGPEVDVKQQIDAAKYIKQECDKAGLTIIGLQPFKYYEGLTDRKKHAEMLEKMKLWLDLVSVMGVDLIQIPTQFLTEGVSGDIDLIVSDLREIADLGLQRKPVVKFAYENLAWGTFIDTWEGMWDVVRRVDRPNFGCCLDTFNIAGRVWADPARADGKVENADEELKASMERLVKTIDISKVFYVQVVDAERMEQPLVEGHPFHNEGWPARMSWSRNARLFAYEEDRGGYLPVREVARVILKELKFEGWVSMELFSRVCNDPDPDTPKIIAKRGFESWTKLKQELDL